MSKVARNALCPCGSGKKYKQCCGNNVVSIHELVDQDVVQHMHDFIRYAAFEHESFLYRTVQEHMIVEQTDDDEISVFRFFISMWAMFFKKDTNGMTIFDYYLRTIRKQAVRPTVYSIIQSWRQAFPTFVCIDELRDSYVVVTDLLTGETKHMKLLDMPDEFDLEEGQALAGIFVPHGQYIACFGTFFPLPVVLTHPLYVYIQDVWKACDEQYEQWIEAYPETFQKSLRLTMFDVESLSPTQEQVFTLFEQNFPQKDLSILDTARLIWVEYCRLNNPTIRKPEVYAAALHYIMADAILHEWIPQKQLAEQYGISVSALSKRIDMFYDIFEDIAGRIDEQLSELFDDWDDDDDWDDTDTIFEVCEDCDEEE
ncbi:YecA family protein [Anoxybacillus eryuanensis]|uniref:YecA family protein n=1 Tax=Anoxybacillus eryuanensis TaxID=651866 RepID=UPI003EF3BF01